MLTFPTPVAVIVAACHLAIAVALAFAGAHWMAVFLVVSVSTAALFAKRSPVEVPDACDA